MKDPVTQTADSAETAVSLVDRYLGATAALERAKQSERGTLTFQFETRSGGTVFNAESLGFMKEIDDIVMSVPGYADYCQLAYDDVSSANATSSGCVSRVSPVLHFFPSVKTLSNGTIVTVPDGKGPLVSDIDAVVRSFDGNRRSLGYFLDGDFNAEKSLVNRITRVKYPMGAPLLGGEGRGRGNTHARAHAHTRRRRFSHSIGQPNSFNKQFIVYTIYL